MTDKWTIAMIRNGSGMDLSRYVGKVFKTREAAWKWQNAQSRNYSVRALPGKWKVGDVVPVGTASVDLLAMFD